jgi:hypothetical protein
MEARLARIIPASPLLVCLCLLPLGRQAAAAGYKTTNFVVSAPTPGLAKEIGDQAEVYRRDLAIEWLGKELPPWSKPCPIHAQVAPNLGAGGATSFIFDHGEVFGWDMKIQGSRERVLDSVLPHEITHTIFASHFRQPVPRWADEGACTTVEHPSEIAKQERNLIQFLKTGHGIPFSQMFAMKEYPPNVMPLYAQGHSLSAWLIQNRGRKAFLEFVGDGMQDENWPRAVRQYYGFPSLLAMQTAWNDWVRQGRPQITPDRSPLNQIASNRSNARTNEAPADQAIYRGQSPDEVTPATNVTTAVTVASASQSVYAAAAQQAERDRMKQTAVYDASRGGATLRR